MMVLQGTPTAVLLDQKQRARIQRGGFTVNVKSEKNQVIKALLNLVAGVKYSEIWSGCRGQVEINMF